MANPFLRQVFLSPLKRLSALLLLVSTVQAGAGTELKPYSATYQLTKDGLAAEVVRELSHSGEREWTLRDSGRVLFFSLEESATVTLDDNNIVPLRYRYDQSPGDSRDQRIRYDWAAKTAYFSLDDGERTAELEEDTHDKLSFQLQLRLDLLTGRLQKPKVYDLVDRGRHKRYRVEKIGEEMVDTGERQIHTLKLRQRSVGKPHETLIWVSPDLDYLIVRMLREEDGDKFEMRLKSVNLSY